MSQTDNDITNREKETAAGQDAGTEPGTHPTDMLSRFLALGAMIEKNVTRQLRPWRITLVDFQVLQALDKRARRQVDLANELRLSKVTVCRQVKGLVELGYLHRDADIADQRAKLHRVTLEGKRVCHEAYRALFDTMQDPALSVDPATRSMLEKMLRNVCAFAEQSKGREEQHQPPIPRGLGRMPPLGNF